MEVPSIFDLKEDDGGILRMPFNPLQWPTVEGNSIPHPCYECGKTYPRGTMKALGSVKEEPKAVRADPFWEYAIFFCWKCWQTSKYSDASKWTARELVEMVRGEA